MRDEQKTKRQLIDELVVLRQSAGEPQSSNILEEKTDEIRSLLFHISQVANGPGSLEELLKTIREQVGKLIDTTNFYVALYEEKNDSYWFPYCVDEYEETERFSRKELKKSLTDYVRRTGIPLLADDDAHRRLIRSGEVDTVRTASKVWMGAPLKTRHGVIGVVAVQDYRRKRAYSQRDLALLSFVSDNIALVIECKKAQKALQESERKYRSLVEESLQGLAVVQDFRIVFANYMLKKITGYAVEELLSLSPEEVMGLVHPDDQQLVWGRLKERLVGKEIPSHYEFRSIRKDGTVRWLEMFAKRIEYLGQPAVQAAVIDVTERKAAEEALRASERWYKRIFEFSPHVVGIIDVKGNVLDVNSRVYDLLGYTREEVVEKNFLSLPFLPDVSKKVAMEHLSQSVRKGALEPYELDFIAKSGEERVCTIQSSPVTDDDGNMLAELVMASDITERKRNEKIQSALYRIAEIASSAENMEEFYSAIHKVVGELMYARNFYIALHDESCGMLSFPYFADEFDPQPEPRKLGNGLTEYVLRTGEPLLCPEQTFRQMVRRGDVEVMGSPSVDWLGVPLKGRGRIFGVLGVQSYTKKIRFTDKEKDLLTFVSQHIGTALERKYVEEMLRENEKKYRTLVEQLAEGIAIVDTEEHFVFANRAAHNIFGVPANGLPGRSLREFTDSENYSMILEQTALRKSGKKSTYQIEIVRPDGGRRILLLTGTPILDKEAGYSGTLAILHDITERRLLESKLSAIHEFSKRISTTLKIEDIVDTTINLVKEVLGHKYCAILLLDKETKELQQTAYLGYSKRLMNGLRLSVDGEGVTAWTAREGKATIVPDVSKDKRYMRVFDDVRSEMVAPLKVGDEVMGVINVESTQLDAFSENDLRLLSALASYLAISVKNSLLFKDLAETKAEVERWNLELEDEVRRRTQELSDAQEQLLRSERLATIGQLAASVGHELRNPLGVVSNSLYFLKLKLKSDDEKVKKHLATMQRELARSDKIISDLLDFSRRREPSFAPTDLNGVVEEALSKVPIPEGVQVVKETAALPTVMADAAQLESILINLISNGVQSMPEGGTLTVKTARNNRSVELDVSDTGVGIAKENLEKIFEPLFTTKSKGIGLGLSVTKRFVENHGGSVRVKSKVNRGSTFTIRLPIEKVLMTQES